MFERRSLISRSRSAALIGALALAMVAAAPVGAAGPSWSIVKSPQPGIDSEFEDVACVTTTSCVAVGQFLARTTSTWKTLIESWNGTAWSLVPSPNPSPGPNPNVDLYGVTCTSSSNCFAVGDHGDQFAYEWKGLILHWNGSAWSILPSPVVAGDLGLTLYSVACTSASNCFAVGDRTDGFDATIAVTERWNGTKWSIVPAPALGEQSGMSGVACPAATTCFALGGDSSGHTVFERWNGSTWRRIAAPTGGSVSGAFSCVSTTNCTAVGGTPTSTLVEHWNGTTWTVVPSPNPPGSLPHFLNAVSCATATSCEATGSTYDSSTGNETMFGLRWNGVAWNLVSTPTPTGPDTTGHARLTNVTCAAAASCIAVGAYDSVSGSFRWKTLAERYR